MFKIDVCKVCGVNCFWIEGIDGDLAEKEVCSPECLAQLQSAQQSVHPTLLESADLQAASTPEHSATSQTDQSPQQRG